MSGSKWLGVIRTSLVARSLPVALALLGMALVSPSAWQGWVADDLIQRDLLLASPLSTVLTDLFVFASPSKNRQLMETGAAPWWTLPTLRVAFLRPLTALTHWVDYRLWPESGALMHAQSIVWYGAVCALAAVAYRRVMGGTWIAGLAAFLFAVDIVHLGSVGWLANRNGLLAACFGLLAFLAHDRWRRETSRSGAVLAPVWLALSLLSAEGGVATGAYLLAHAVFLDHGAWHRRIGALLPCGAVVVAWQLAYQRLGFGAWGTGFYVDPGREPGRFAAAALDRGPVLLASQWLGQFPMVYNLVSEPTRRAVWVLALLVVILLAFALAPLLRRDRVARMWAAGMVLAAVPACSISLLSGRLLLFASLGAMGLMGQFIGGLVDRAGWVPTSGPWRRPLWALGLVLIALHVVLAPVVMPIIARSPDAVQDVIERVTELGPLPAGAHPEVIVVNAPSPFEFIYLASLRRLQGRSVPRVRMLAPGYAAVRMVRLDHHTVVMRPEEGYLAPPGGRKGSPAFDLVYVYRLLDGFFRSEAFPMTLGAEVTVGGMRAAVTGLTDDGRPSEARLRFAASLEDPSLMWLYWDWGRGAYVTFVPPAIGESVRIPGPFEGSPPGELARRARASAHGLGS